MKVFISSVIRGLEKEREAAERAAKSLDHTVLRSEDFVRFVITDHGLGIPPAEQDRIFEKFYRLDPDMARGIGGTGLGLYISRELVRRVNGRIWVEPNDLRGSIFYVEVPAAKEPAPGRNPRKRARASA